MLDALKIFIIFAAITVAADVCAAQTQVKVPLGKAVAIDGKIEPAEWADALPLDLTNGGKLFLKFDGAHLLVAMRGAKAGWSHLYVNDGSGSRVSVIHASAALGRVIYEPDASTLWQPKNEFAWEIRERAITAEVRNSMGAYLKKNGWVASNNNMGNAAEVEYKLAARPDRKLSIAAVFMSEGVAPQHFPATLADDTLKQDLLAGNVMRDLKFDATGWASLALTQPKAVGRSEGFWKGEVMRDGKRWRVGLRIGQTGATADFLDLDVIDVAFPLYIDGPNVRLEKPQPSGHPIIFDGKVNGDRFAGKWRGFGVDGTFELKRTKPEAKKYREEEVAFQNGDVKLSGTLLLPISRSKSPAVVLVHGSSPNERTSYRSWARHFATSGIAALIYDKRGAGRSTGNTRSASMEDLADDAIAGIRMLKLRRDIDVGKVGIAGHSQGGWIAPLAAARSGDVAFVITSAAAAVTPAEQSIYHRAGMMKQAGMTDAEIAEATRLREKLYLLNRKILAKDPDIMEMRASISRELSENKAARWFSPAELPPELTGELPPRGALELLFFDASPVWPKVKVPVLALWGDRDTVVPVEKSREMIQSYLEKAGNKDLTIKVMPGVDHGNNVVSDGGVWDFPRSNSEYDRTMVEWLLKRVG